MRPSAVSRAPFLSGIERPFLRRISTALSMSPPASVRAALQSIIGWLVRSRRALTAAAEIAVMGRASSVRYPVPSSRPPFVATDHGQRAADRLLLNDRGGRLGVRGAGGARGGGGGGGRAGRADGGAGAAGPAAARRRLLLGRQGGAALADSVGQPGQDQLDRADAVVVARDGQVHRVGVAVGVD